MRSVLITRPKEAAQELAERLQGEGFEVFQAPLMEYEELPADFSALVGCQALLFTSIHAVHVFCRKVPAREWPVFAVGDATARAASGLGFSRVWSASGDSASAVALIRDKKDALKIDSILHIAGEDTAQDIRQALGAFGVTLERLPVYRARLVESLPPEVIRALQDGRIDAVTFFSARAAAHFAHLVRTPALDGATADMEAVCISARVATALGDAPFARVSVAGNPHLESMLDILRQDARSRAYAQALPAEGVIAAFGGLRPLANRLGITASTVQGWKKRGVIPSLRVAPLMAAAEADGIDIGKFLREQDNRMTGDDDKTPDSRHPLPGQDIPARAGEWHERRTGADRRNRRAAPDRRGHVHAPTYAGPDRRAGLDRRAYLERQRQRVRHEKVAFVQRSMLTFALMFIPIVLVGVFVMAPEYIEMKEKAARAKELEARMAAMDARMAELQKNAPQTSMGAAINRGLNKIEDLSGSVASAAGAVAQAAAGAAAQEGNAAALAQVLTNINALNRTPQGQAAAKGAMDKLKNILAGWSGDPQDLNAAVDVAKKQDATLAGILGDVSGRDLGAAAMLLTLNEFRGNVGRQQPFAQDLALMRKFAGSDPALQQSLNRLAPYAESGVLSRARLQQEFKGLAMDIVMAKLQGQDLSVQEQALRRLNKFVKVRRVDDIEGQSVDAVVARAQLMLDQGDIEGATRELQTLQGAPAQTAQPWIAQAQGVSAAEQSAADIVSALMSRMSSPQGLSLEGIFSTLSEGAPDLTPPAMKPATAFPALP